MTGSDEKGPSRFAEFARLCGGGGFRVDHAEDLEPTLEAALAVDGGPALVEVRTSGRWVWDALETPKLSARSGRGYRWSATPSTANR